jgi:ABC-2 type transport system permease protein
MLSIIQTYWKEAIAYKFEALMSLIIGPVRFIVLVAIWSAVFANSGDAIAQYDLSQMITYLVISTIVATTTYTFIHVDMATDIRKGDFTKYLLKPISFIHLGLLHKVANRSYAFVVEVIPLILILCFMFSQYIAMGNMYLLIPSLILAFLLSYYIWFIIGCIAFWLVNIRSLGWLFSFFITFASGMMVPIDLFPEMIAKILYFTPFIYINFVPTSLYLGTADYTILIAQAAWTLVMYGLCKLVWYVSVRKYGGVGQ